MNKDPGQTEAAIQEQWRREMAAKDDEIAETLKQTLSEVEDAISAQRIRMNQLKDSQERCRQQTNVLFRCKTALEASIEKRLR